MPTALRPLTQLLLLLLLFQCCVLALGDKEDSVAALRRLREAVSQHDVEEVQRLIREKVLHPQLVLRAPSPLYWVANEKADTENLARITQILLEHFGESNYDYDRYHPLTRAAHHNLKGVMATLLSWPTTISEVHAKYLWCEDLSSLPVSVRVVITPDSPRCFREFPRVVAFERSELVALARRHKARTDNTPAEEFEWSNPFLSPPPGKKPPMKHLVMNPRSFTDFVGAVTYYFWGEWATAYTIMYCVIVSGFGCLSLGVLVAAARRE